MSRYSFTAAIKNIKKILRKKFTPYENEKLYVKLGTGIAGLVRTWKVQ